MKPAQARRKGVEAESAVRDYLVSRGLVCERIPSGNREDHGDLLTFDEHHYRYCVQVKHYVDTSRAIREGMAELSSQMEHCGADFGFVVQRPRGVTDPARFRVVMTLDQMATLLGGV